MSDELDCLQFVYYCQQSVETVQGVLHYPGDLTTDEVKTVVGLMKKWKKGLLDEAASQKLPYRSRSRGRSRSRSRSRSRESGNPSMGTQGSAGDWEETGGAMEEEVVVPSKSKQLDFDEFDSDEGEPGGAAARQRPATTATLFEKGSVEKWKAEVGGAAFVEYLDHKANYERSSKKADRDKKNDAKADAAKIRAAKQILRQCHMCGNWPKFGKRCNRICKC